MASPRYLAETASRCEDVIHTRGGYPNDGPQAILTLVHKAQFCKTPAVMPENLAMGAVAKGFSVPVVLSQGT